MADRVKMTAELEGSRGGDRSVLLLAVSYLIITIMAILLGAGALGGKPVVYAPPQANTPAPAPSGSTNP
jgi:hypothetical protein